MPKQPNTKLIAQKIMNFNLQVREMFESIRILHNSPEIYYKIQQKEREERKQIQTKESMASIIILAARCIPHVAGKAEGTWEASVKTLLSH